jgi:cytochrome c556
MPGRSVTFNGEDFMNRIRYAVALFTALLLYAGLPALICAGHDNNASHSPAPPATAAPNPLIEEMLTLDSVFRNIVSAVAIADAAQVQKVMAPLHGAMEKTHEGIHAGTVTIPKNAARIGEFVERDRKFHEMLEALDRAAGHNHQQEMLRITKQLLDGCVQCHRTFRK